MKTPTLLLAVCLSALLAPLSSCHSQGPPALTLATDLNSYYDPTSGNTREDRLSNQLREQHFHVVLTNVSAHPVVILDSIYAFSFEVTNPDGTTFKIEPNLESHAKYVIHYFRLAPGETLVRDIYCSTGAVFAAAHTYPQDGRTTWSPEFPFEKNQDKKITVRAVFEQRAATPAIKDLWEGRVLSAPQAVVLSDQSG